MANKKQAKIKAMGDQMLVAEIEKLQHQIALVVLLMLLPSRKRPNIGLFLF